MESPWSIVGITSAAALGVYCVFSYTRRSPYRLPPKPLGWPVIGNIPQLVGGKGVYYKLLAFRERYGDLFRVQMGQHTLFVVFGRRYFHELLIEKGDLVSNRPSWLYTPHQLTFGKGIIWSNGKAWQSMQALLRKTQEDSKCVSALQRHLTAEYEEFKNLFKDKSSTYSLDYLIRQASFNFLSAFLIGKRFGYSDSTINEMRDKIESYGFSMATVNIENYIPLLAFLNKSKIQKATDDQDFVYGILQENLEERRRLTSDTPESFLEMYLAQPEGERLKEGMSELDALRAIIDMYVGGRDNLITYTKWMLMTLAKYPDIQSKCRAEILEVVGRDRRIQLEDRVKTPYTLATVKELLRMRAPVVLAPFHTPTQDITLGEFDIPKGSIILVDCKAPNYDKAWSDPEVFKPERFLGVSEQQLPKSCFVPYGTGPRYCMGKYVSDIFEYLFTAHILQDFQIMTKNPDNELSMEDIFDIFGLRPQHFDEIVMKPLE